MYTNHNLCTDALRKIGVIAADTNATADEIATALTALDRMLKAWQNRGFNLWQQDAMSLPATTAATYALTSPRPLEVQSVRYKNGAIEIPMYRMNREEYDTLPDKTTKGVPTTFYYNRGRDAGTLYVWPVPATVTTQTIELTYVGPTADVTPAAAVDLPPEWFDAAVYSLAARLADEYQVDAGMVTARAERELDLAMSYDREGSVYFVECG